MTALRSPRLWLALYAAVGLYTGSRSAAYWQHIENSRTAECRVLSGDLAYMCNPATTRPAAAFLFSALLWPAYWAWELQQ